MSEQDALVERVTEAIYEADVFRSAGEDGRGIPWGRLIQLAPTAAERYRDKARAAIAAVREADDAPLARHNVTDVHCVRLRMDDDDTAPMWRAFLCRNHVVSAETMWSGDGPDREAAIRAAVEAALAGEDTDTLKEKPP